LQNEKRAAKAAVKNVIGAEHNPRENPQNDVQAPFRSAETIRFLSSQKPKHYSLNTY
jgi:hypothetical protein